MQLTTIVVTRNKAAGVKTLHTLLKLNILCLENNVHNRIMFSNDDAATRKSVLLKHLKTSDRILWIDYGIFVDEDSLRQVVGQQWESWHGVVFPCVKDGIDWDMFRKKKDSQEALSQKGLHFDTEVSKRVKDDFYAITHTDPKCFCIDTKHFLKNLKKDHVPMNHGDMFAELSQTKFKTVAYTNAKLIVTYPHECLGNILGAAGVTANA